MERWKRLIYYLLINVLVSACTIITVLFVWDRFNQPEVLTPVPVQAVTVTAPSNRQTPPTSTPLPAPTQAYESYQVQPGDTLGAIADRFDLTVAQIIEANQLENPDVLEVGDILLIPLPPEQAALDQTQAPGSAPASATPPPTLSAGKTSTPLPPGFDPQLEIVTVVGAGNLDDERVVIKLNGEVEISLLGWRLEDQDGNSYLFPELTLFKDGAVTISTKAGINTVVELYWGLEEAVWEVGETVSLVDPQGNERARYQIP